MKTIVWDVEYITMPPAARYCKKCGKKTDYHSSGQFRINAQKKSLDIWLIYNCSICSTSWNLTICSRISYTALPSSKLEQFHRNDPDLAQQYALDYVLLQKNGAVSGSPEYVVTGTQLPDADTELLIRSKYPSNLKIAALLREKLDISSNKLEYMIQSGQLQCRPPQDLKKCRLTKEVRLLYQIIPEPQPNT